MARLDRLGPAKEVAQIGAAIGREFSHALLAAAVRKPEAELLSALDRLIAAGLLFRQGVTPHATYLFKHALVQDAAYGTLLRKPRRAFMHASPKRLRANSPTSLRTSRNCSHVTAPRPDKSRRRCFCGQSGAALVGRSALVEAVAQLTRALDQIATLPTTPALRREEIKLQVALITPLIYVKGLRGPRD